LASPDDFIAASISAYSGGESRVEMNFPRFSFFGSIGLPTFGVSLISFSFDLAAAEFSGAHAMRPRI
jgi:hypothetical protein